MTYYLHNIVNTEEAICSWFFLCDGVCKPSHRCVECSVKLPFVGKPFEWLSLSHTTTQPNWSSAALACYSWSFFVFLFKIPLSMSDLCCCKFWKK
jgi:hypothetical protein